MNQPVVSVGIMYEEQIQFDLKKAYTVLGRNLEGTQSVKIENGKVLWNGELFDEVLFTPVDEENASFELIDVTIGINFHWERKENQVFQGSLKFIVENDKLTAINIIRVEDYLTSVISSEMSATASLDLLKAHAVISRSWLLAQIQKNKEITDSNTQYSAFTETEDELIRWYDREDHTNFDVCADDHCQRYQGITRASTNMVKQAIKETFGQTLMSESKICDARFSKCCGGVVEEFENCWEDIHFPYLVKLKDAKDSNSFPDLKIEAESVKWIKESPDAFCNTKDKKILSQVLNNYDQETVDFYRWKTTYSQDELSALVLERSGIDFGTITDLIPVERGTSGRLIKLKIVGTKRTLTIGKELEIRRILSKSHLYSSAFIVSKDADTFTLTGAGWGHGVGLCQIGAAVMGEQGYNYDQILLHYYVGATIEKLY